jgi:hypothetical protein
MKGTFQTSATAEEGKCNMLSISEIPTPKGNREVRVVLPDELVKAVTNSFDSDTAILATFETEKLAKGVHTKLRSLLNSQGHGLRTWGPTENAEGNWEISFKGTAELSTIDDSPEAIQARVDKARAGAADPDAEEARVRQLAAARAAKS